MTLRLAHALALAAAAVALSGCATASSPATAPVVGTSGAPQAATVKSTPAAPTGDTKPAGGLQAKESSPATSPLTGRTIVIDPGHNGGATVAFNSRQVPAGNGRTKACNTFGTASPGGLGEHTVNFRLAQALAANLRERGANVVLTRTTDTGAGPCVNERAAIGNRASADAVISLHADGNLSGTARGFHVIRSRTMIGGPTAEAASKALAEKVVSEFEKTGMPRSTYTGGREAITARDDIAGLNLLNVPGVMLEAGNVHHPTDARLLASPEFAKAEVAALTRALESWLARQ